MLMAVPTLVASIVPMTVGFAAALQTNGSVTAYDLLWFLLATVAVILIETGKNTVNEYFDYLSGTDRFVDEEHLTPFSGGRRVLPSGILSGKEVICIGVVTFGLAIAAGLVMAFFKTFLIFWIGIIGIAISICYTLPPFKLCYRGLGELAVGIVYGPLILLGTYTLIAEQYSLQPLLLSLPLGFLISNVLVINEFPDYEADTKAGKKNLVVLLGKPKAVYLHGGLFFLAYASILPAIIYSGNFLLLLIILTAPIAVKACVNCKKNYDNIAMLTNSNKMTIAVYALTGVLIIAAIVSGLFL